MSKYISIFFLTIMVVFALYMIFGSIFMAGVILRKRQSIQ